MDQVAEEQRRRSVVKKSLFLAFYYLSSKGTISLTHLYSPQ